MANIANFFSNLFGGSKQSSSVLGIDIGSSSIKVVQLAKKNGHVVLETYGELSLGPYISKNVGEATNLPLEKIIEALNDMLKEKEVNITTRVCGLAIPFASSLITVIDMPNLPKEQLVKMVPLEARKYIPVPISEVSLDWYIIPENQNSESDSFGEDDKKQKTVKVLVVVLHNDTLIRYKEIVTRSFLEASFFEIEIFSTMRSVLDQEITPILVIDMGATTTKLYIVEKGILNSSHMINRGAQSITSELSKSLGISIAEAEILKREKGLSGVVNDIQVRDVIAITLDYVFSEANRFIIAYEKKYAKNVAKVIMVGGGSALKGIIDVAKRSFQGEVLGGDPFSKVIAPAFLEKILRETGPQFAVSVGVALRRLQELE